jgi:hypothetical protein
MFWTRKVRYQPRGKIKYMKQLKCLFIFFIAFVSINCYSQQLLKTVNDAQKINANEELFINKPLKNLLNEIRPPIKRVTANPSINIQSSVGYFIFNFVDSKQKDSLRVKNKIPVTIVVYVKEYFEWDYHKRPKGKETIWTESDSKKYGNLTIVGFRIYGDSSYVPPVSS